MNLVIVPDSLKNTINEKLDAAYLDAPDAAIDRDIHYHSLLNYFNEYGEIPEFSIVKNPETE